MQRDTWEEMESEDTEWVTGGDPTQCGFIVGCD